MNNPGRDSVYAARFERTTQTDRGVERSVRIMNQRDMGPPRLRYHRMWEETRSLMRCALERELAAWVYL